MRKNLSTFDEPLLELVKRFTKADDDLDAMIEVITVFKGPWGDVQARANEFDEVLRPRRSDFGIKRCHPARDTLYADSTGDAYERYGIAKDAMILVRPDQYVAGVYEMSGEGVKLVESFLERILVPAEAVNGN